jgi:hypothetical protein
MTNRNRTLVWIGSVLALACVYLWLFGIQTGFALQAWNIGRKVPEVKNTPRDLTDLSVNSSSGTSLSYFGYTFEIPWNDVDNAKSKKVGSMQVLAFHSGMAILVSSIPPRDFVKTVAGSTGGEETLRRTYGNEVTSSDYSFNRAMLSATPATVEILGSREDAARGFMLLLIKTMAMPLPASSGIYSIRTPHFQGFQFGDPRASSGKIIVDLWDDKGGIELHLACFGTCSAPHITQADVNRISESLARVAPVTATDSLAAPRDTIQASSR